MIRRKIKNTRKTQPLRKAGPRQPTRPLRAATKGRPQQLTTAHEMRRAALSKRRRKLKIRRAIRRDPLLTLLPVRRRL